jgi:hypothetical protein
LRKQIIGKSVEKFECCCKNCELEMSDQEIEEMKMLNKFVDMILETYGYPEEIYDILSILFRIGKDIGWGDYKDMMIEFLSDIE